MKKITFIIALIILTLGSNLSAQESNYPERHGGALNLGLGIGGYYGYYGYIGHALPIFDINYEFGIARNFTLAPFITLGTYSDANFTSFITPIGVKGSYYLDELFHADSRWDFYVAGSLGIALVSTTWNSNYPGDRTYYTSANPLYLALHLGTEYHISRNIGIFLDLSTGVSTIGIAIH